MYKIQTLFNTPDTVGIDVPEVSTIPQDSRITLNEITLLSKMQAVTRYNLGAASIRKIADECGAVIHIGKRVLYHRQTIDDYFGNRQDRS